MIERRIQVANTVCTTILFTLVLNASIVHYPFMQRDPSIWKMNLFRTLAAFLAPTVIEFGTEVYLYRLHQEQKRTLMLLVLILIWILTIGGAIPLHVRLAYHPWNQSAFETLLIVNWIRASLWSIRFVFVTTDALRSA